MYNDECKKEEVKLRLETMTYTDLLFPQYYIQYNK